MASRKTNGWGLELLGLDESVSNLNEVEKCFGIDKIKDYMMPLAKMARDLAKRKVKRDSDAHPPGYLHLQDAIFAARGKENLPSVILGVDRKKAPHSHLIEFGHDLWRGGRKRAGQGHLVGTVRAHPYLRPAFDAVRVGALKVVSTMVNVQLSKMKLRRLTAKRGGLAKPPGV